MGPRRTPCSNGKYPPPSFCSGCNSNNKGSFNPPADAALVVEDAAGDVAMRTYPINREHTCSMALIKEVADSETSSSFNIQGIHWVDTSVSGSSLNSNRSIRGTTRAAMHSSRCNMETHARSRLIIHTVGPTAMQ